MSHKHPNRTPKERIKLITTLLKKKEDADMPKNVKVWSEIDMGRMSRKVKRGNEGKRKTKY